MKIHDVIGVGFGPANIALAIAFEEFGFGGSCLFLERRDGPSWQPEMLLPGSDIQNHPCRDLVTPRNPRSRYTFMNFLVENGRLFEHLNLGIEFPLRYEYAQYVSWVAQFFAQQVRYGSTVDSLRIDPAHPTLFRISTSDGAVFYARAVVVAPGRTPLIPDAFKQCDRSRVFHLTEFMGRVDALDRDGAPQHIGVVGGSQSAAELVLYLRERYPNASISNVMRGYGYRLKDTSQFSEHVYFPEFVDYYFGLDPAGKKNLNRQLHHTNYSSVDKDVITHLYAKMYEDKIRNTPRIHMLGCRTIERCVADDKAPGRLTMHLQETNKGVAHSLTGLDAVVLATGFRNLGTGPNEEPCPQILADLYADLAVGADGVLRIGRDYSLAGKASITLPPLYLNGLCESSHGYGDAGSFSLLAFRAAEIYRSLDNSLSGRHGTAPQRLEAA